MRRETPRFETYFYRGEADMRRLPVATLLLLLALLVRGLRMSARILRMLLGLAGIFLALGMVILAVRVGRCAMRLRCGFVMFRRLVVFVFHGVSSLLAEEYRVTSTWCLSAASTTRQWWWNK